MRQYRVLSVNYPNLPISNIGDYIQALASSQFLPRVDGFIEREALCDYDDDPCHAIMNAWYMHDASKWPPSPKIDPLFVAVHINSQVEKEMLSPVSIAYFKKHEPIGCRDERTRDLLLKYGVKAYFSGCMTLTLGYKYKSTECDGSYYFVDVPLNRTINVWNCLKWLTTFILHLGDILTISRKFYPFDTKTKLLFNTTIFYQEYSKLFTRDILLDAKYICQQSKHWKLDFENDFDRLAEAERLVKEYAKAKLVITSRIHCALPCLAVETPVLYIHNPKRGHVSNCRLSGLLELFNIIIYQDGHLEQPSFVKGKINKNYEFKNKDEWRHLADALISICKKWVHNTES